MNIEHAKCTVCAGVESPGFYTGCMIKDGATKGNGWSCDGEGNLARLVLSPISPERKALIEELTNSASHLSRFDLPGATMNPFAAVCLKAARALASDASWEQVARAQDAKLHAMTNQPGGIEKLREVLAQAEK